MIYGIPFQLLQLDLEYFKDLKRLKNKKQSKERIGGFKAKWNK